MLVSCRCLLRKKYFCLSSIFPYLTFLTFLEQVTEAREVLEKALGISETLVTKLNAISQWLVQAAIDIQASSEVKLLRQKLTEMRDRKHDIREVLAIKQEFVSLCADPSLLVGLKESLTGLESKWSALRDELRRRLPDGETSSDMAELDLSGDESYRLTSPATTLNHSISSSSGSGGGEEAAALHEFRAAFQAVFRIRILRIHMFLGHPDPEVWIRLWIRIRILLSSCKNSKKNLDSYYFVTLFDFLSLKNDVNVPSKSNKQKKIVLKN